MGATPLVIQLQGGERQQRERGELRTWARHLLCFSCTMQAGKAPAPGELSAWTPRHTIPA